MASFLEPLLGSPLVAVTYSGDDVQLAFNGPRLTVFTPITLRVEGQTSTIDDPTFRDALASFVGRPVTYLAFKPDIALTLTFGEDRSLSISLRPDDYNGGQAILFQNPGPASG